MKDGTSRQSLWNRDFATALSGYFFGFLSVSLFLLFPLYLDQFHPSKSWIGLIMGIHSVASIAVRPFFGRIVDERGGRRMAVLGISCMVSVTPAFHLVRDAGILVLLLRTFIGAGWGIAMTATMAACFDFSPLDRLAHSVGIIGVGGIVAGAAGPALGEEVVRRWGFAGLFNASLLLLAAGLLCMLATREVPRSQSMTGAARETGFKSQPAFVLAAIAAMPVAHGAVRGALVNFVALFAADAGFGRVGPFFLVFSGAAVLTRIGIGDISDRYGRKEVIFPTALLIAANTLFLATARSNGSFLLSGFVAGLGQGLIFPALSTYIIDFLGREKKGFALGLYLSLFDLGMGLGSPLFGWISDAGGYRSMYAVAGSMIFLFSVLFHAKAPRLKTGQEPVSRRASTG